MSDVYLCYSRKDIEFARTLHEALEKSNHTTWVDWEGITEGTELWKEIEKGIEGADTFVFVISPDSVSSKGCQDEINHAVKHNKRILPIFYRDAHEFLDKNNPAHIAISQINWLFFQETDNVEQSFKELIDVLDFYESPAKTKTTETISKLEKSLQEPFAKFDSPVYSIAFSPDGRSVVAALENGNLELRSLREGDVTKKTFQGHHTAVRCVSFSPDGQILASASGDNTIKLWKVEAGEVLLTLTGHENFVTSVSFSPDGQTLASASRNGMIKLWEVETGEELLTLTEHKDFVTSVSFSPDGQTLASASGDRTIKLWKVETGEELLTLTGYESHVNSVSFSPDGQTLASASWDNTIKLWAVEIGEELLTLTGHEDYVNSVSFSPDGQTLGSGGKDGTIRLWDVKIGKQLSSLPQLFGLPKLLVKNYIGQELQNDLAQGDDQLSIKTEIDALTNVLMLRELKPPLAVGILGGWGSGKSFALHLMKQRINEIRSEALTEKQAWGESEQIFPYVGHIYQIEFDAWTYAKSNLWASLMQKVFFELNRQISLEEELKKAEVDLLKGGQIWKILNNMSDEQRQSLLKNEALMRDLFKSPDLYENWKDSKSLQEFSSVLWSKFSELRQEEVEKLKNEQESLLKAQNELKQKQIDIEKQVDQEIYQKSRSLQWEPLKEDLKKVMGNAFDIFESQLTKETDTNTETKIKADNVKIILDDLEPELWQSLLKTFKQNPKLSILFLTSFLLLIFSPLILTSLNEWLSQNTLLSNFIKQRSILLTTSPVVISGIPFIQKAWKGWKKYKKQVKQVLERYQTQVIDNQEKLAQSRQTRIEIEKATNQDLIKLENEIKQKEALIEQQQQRIGLTTAYKSLNELINIRHQTDPYSEQLGLLQQVKSDIEELTNCLVIQDDDSPEIKDKKRESFVRGPARVVLYIDDLDRCPPHKVVEVLEAVQLLVKTSLFIVVLAIDDRYISRALEDVYKGVLKRRGKPSGIDYLEKIIQIPYRMRPISPINLKKYLQSQMTVEEEQSEASETIPIAKSPTSEPSQSNTPKATKTDSPDVNQEKKSDLPQSDEPTSQTQAPELKPIAIAQEKTPELPKPEPSPQNPETISEIIKFTRAEFDLLANCSKHVDLSPRTGKRLINLYKILKIVWSQYPSLGLKEPDAKTKQIAITFLALSGRYPDFTRHLFEEIDTKFEESSDSNEDNPTLTWKLQDLLNELKKQVSKNDHHNQREWRKFEHDLRQMLKTTETQSAPSNENATTEASNNDSFSLDRETFRLALSFCFVGDIGYDPDDYHLPQITNH